MSSRTTSRGILAGLLLVGLGVLLLFDRLAGASLTANLVPILTLGLGFLFFVGMVSSGRGAGGLAIPGSILTTIGLISLSQSFFGRPELWAAAWPLIVCSVGVGLFIMGLWNDNPAGRRAGLIVLLVGMALFFLFTVAAQLGWGRLGRLTNLVWPLLLIGFGVLLIARRLLWSSAPPAPPAAPTDAAPAPEAPALVDGRTGLS